MINSANKAALFCGLILSAPAIQAQVDEPEDLFALDLGQLMDMEVEIATGTKKTLSKAPAAVTLITANDLKKTGATNVIEALEGVPGVHVRYNRSFYTPFIHIRGTSTNQVMLMVNGQSLRSVISPWPQDVFWKGMSVNAVERVEIIRGPGSALYGSQASAGVVNIITKTANDIEESEAGLRVGSFDTQSVFGQYGTTLNEMRAGATYDISRTEGHNPYIVSDKSGSSDDIGLGYKNVDLRTYLAQDSWRIQADFIHNFDTESGLDGGTGFFDPITSAETRRINLGWDYSNRNLISDWKLDAKMHYQNIYSSSGDGYYYGDTKQERSNEHHLTTEVSGLYSGVADHEITLGLGHKWLKLDDVTSILNGVENTGTAAAFAEVATRNENFLYLQDVWKFSDDLEFTAGGRYDSDSDFDSVFNPRAAVVWKSSEKLTSKLLYGEAFRAPSFVELQKKRYAVLNPESSKTIELAFNYVVNRELSLSMNLFEFDSKNVIKFSGSTGTYYNGGNYGVNGVELEAQWVPRNDLRISGNVTARRPDENSERNDYEPYKDGYLRVDWEFKPAWNLDVQANWTADRRRSSSNSTSVTTGAYNGLARPDLDNNFVVDTTVRYEHSNQWEFAASVKNLLNDDARESTGKTVLLDLPLPERNVFVEMRYKF